MWVVAHGCECSDSFNWVPSLRGVLYHEAASASWLIFLAFVFYLRSMTLFSASASLLALSGLQPVTFLTRPWFIPSITRLASCGRLRKQSGLTFKVSAAAVFHPLQMLLWWQMLAVAPGGSEYYRVCRGQSSQSSNLWKNQSYKGATESC